MNERYRGPCLALGLVLAWRLTLLVFTSQPIPENDAFLFDGAVVNWLLHGQYFNPSLAEAFPISGHQVFAAYPPLYQVGLLFWMSVFGTSVWSALWMHLVMFGVAGLLTVTVIRSVFPVGPRYALAVLFLFGVTFDDRPEGLAHIFGLLTLWLTAQGLCGKVRGFAAEWGIALALLGALYTSPILGAFYFGVAFLTRAAAWFLGRQRIHFAAFVLVVALFTGITLFIARAYPLLWQGFLENARKTPVCNGFRIPATTEILKLGRTAPVFLIAIGLLPFLLTQRKRLLADASGDIPWLSLTVGVAVMGTLMLAAAMVLASPNYVMYVLFAQVLLTAGLLALGWRLAPGSRRGLWAALVCCLALVSVRAVGMTTWGLACAADVSHSTAIQLVRGELDKAPPDSKVVLSSAFLYEAARHRQVTAIHEDWVQPARRGQPEDFGGALLRLRPAELILTQFDYYRRYQPVLEDLKSRRELVEIELTNAARTPPPDAFKSFQKVVQHVSWAPVIVRFNWKYAASGR
jgi:hypothetical protein